MHVRLRTSALVLSLCVALPTLAACDAGGSSGPSTDGGGAGAADAGATDAPAVPKVRITTNVSDRAAVPVDHRLSVQATHGTLTAVRVTSPAGEVAGRLADGAWEASSLLEPGSDYVVRSTAEREDGTSVERTSRFHTQDLTLDEQTYASIAPLAGETVGVGMPVIVTFDVPVADKATFEKHMRVTSTPRQPGAWHWISDTEAHWRPRTYWKAGTDVSVDVDVNSLPAGGGVYGQESRTVDFHVGDAVVSKVDARTHQMRTFINGDLAKVTPITTGKAGFTTRSGVKVIMEKFRSRAMRSETIGIGEGDPEFYDLDDVEYAMRLTYSGEFIHAAPWSVGSQGRANVSHGCTGMSTADAKWIYDHSKRGDVVEYVGTDRPMTLTNGYGDWNEPFAEYKQGSALS